MHRARESFNSPPPPKLKNKTNKPKHTKKQTKKILPPPPPQKKKNIKEDAKLLKKESRTEIMDLKTSCDVTRYVFFRHHDSETGPEIP